MECTYELRLAITMEATYQLYLEASESEDTESLRVHFLADMVERT